VIHLSEDAEANASGWQVSLPPGSKRRVTRRLDSALQKLHESLDQASMGARLYLVGNEDIIWQASKVADRFGMGADAVRRHRLGTLARPVYCVHCRTTTRGVRTNVADCSGCGRALFVRDHFSRHLGAYMGFQIDARSPASCRRSRSLPMTTNATALSAVIYKVERARARCPASSP
jgi:hypothetical protein